MIIGVAAKIQTQTEPSTSPKW